MIKRLVFILAKRKGGEDEKEISFICQFCISLNICFVLFSECLLYEWCGHTELATSFLAFTPDSDFSKVDLATTPEGSVIMATVVDPNMIGGSLKGDRVKLINLGNGEWEITRLANGSGFQFIAQKKKLA